LIYPLAPLSRVRYKLLEHTADAYVEVHGKNISELFENAAYAMFDLMTDLKKVEQKGEMKVTLSADTREQLLIDFLGELLYLHETEDLVFSKFDIKTDGKNLEAFVWGEKFDSKKHSKRTVVKAITYHKLEFDDKKGILTVLFDI